MEEQPNEHIWVRYGESVQRAIDRARAGTVIELEPGIYKEKLNIEKSLTLRGSGKTPQETQIIGTVAEAPVITIAEYQAEWEMVWKFIDGGGEVKGELPRAMRAKVAIENLTCQSEKGVGLSLAGSTQVLLQGCHLVNSSVGLKVGHGDSPRIPDSLRKALVQAQHEGIDIFTYEFALPTQLVLKDCAILNNKDGIVLDASKLRFIGKTCLISQNSGTGLSLEGGNNCQFYLTDCTVSDNGKGLVIWDSTSDVKLCGNRFLNNQGPGIDSNYRSEKITGCNNEMRGNGVDLIGFVPASVRKPLVSTTKTRYLSVPRDYPSLQQAIDAIAPGGTIQVSSGRFQEGVTIWKSVVIQGSGSKRTVLEVPHEKTPCVSVLPETKGVHLRDIEILGHDADNTHKLVVINGGVRLERVRISGAYTGIYVSGGLVSLNDCEIRNNAEGLCLWWGNVTLRDCVLSHNAQKAIFLGRGREYSPGPACLRIESSSVLENGDGVYAHNSEELIVQNSSFSRNMTCGLNLDWPGRTAIENSVISDNNQAGLKLMSGRISLDKCTISGNRKVGLEIMFGRISLEECTISGNGEAGLHVSDAGANVTSCTISKNKGYGLVLDNAAHAMLIFCTLQGNARDALRAGGVSTMASHDSLHTGAVIQVMLQSCKFLENGGHGISLWDKAQATIQDSLIADNGVDGLRVEGRTAVWLQNCCFLRNQAYGIKTVIDPVQNPRSADDLEAVIDRVFKESRIDPIDRSPSGPAMEPFVTGSDNRIPGPDDQDGNQQGALEPTYPGWPWPKGFLKEI